MSKLPSVTVGAVLVAALLGGVAGGALVLGDDAGSPESRPVEVGLKTGAEVATSAPGATLSPAPAPSADEAAVVSVKVGATVGTKPVRVAESDVRASEPKPSSAPTPAAEPEPAPTPAPEPAPAKTKSPLDVELPEGAECHDGVIRRDTARSPGGPGMYECRDGRWVRLPDPEPTPVPTPVEP